MPCFCPFERNGRMSFAEPGLPLTRVAWTDLSDISKSLAMARSVLICSGLNRTERFGSKSLTSFWKDADERSFCSVVPDSATLLNFRAT